MNDDAILQRARAAGIAVDWIDAIEPAAARFDRVAPAHPRRAASRPVARSPATADGHGGRTDRHSRRGPGNRRRAAARRRADATDHDLRRRPAGNRAARLPHAALRRPRGHACGRAAALLHRRRHRAGRAAVGSRRADLFACGGRRSRHRRHDRRGHAGPGRPPNMAPMRWRSARRTASFPTISSRFGPYSPSSRLFRNPCCSIPRRWRQRWGRADLESPLIDWPSASANKYALFRRLYEDFLTSAVAGVRRLRA